MQKPLINKAELESETRQILNRIGLNQHTADDLQKLRDIVEMLLKEFWVLEKMKAIIAGIPLEDRER